jgi:hypothetical protein
VKRSDATQLVGVDGGASTLRAWAIDRTPDGRLEVSGKVCRRDMPRAGSFLPVPLERQLTERAAPLLSPEERSRADLVTDLAGDTVVEATRERNTPLVLGICMPGLTEAGGRGIAVLRNGARLPGFLDHLEERLRRSGLPLARPAGPLVADSHAAGWGEEFAPDGQFRGVRNALYLAGGTGVAETVKLAGRFPPPATLRRILPPAWKLRSAAGPPFEDLVSMAAIHAAWSGRPRRGPTTGCNVAEECNAGRPRWIEEGAIEGNELARKILRRAATDLAELLHTRLISLRRGPGALLDRIVLGQRTGVLFADPRLAPCFAQPLRDGLTQRISDSDDAHLRDAYLEEGELKGGLLVSSPRHAAPAIGAVAAALGMVHRDDSRRDDR